MLHEANYPSTRENRNMIRNFLATHKAKVWFRYTCFSADDLLWTHICSNIVQSRAHQAAATRGQIIQFVEDNQVSRNFVHEIVISPCVHLGKRVCSFMI